MKYIVNALIINWNGSEDTRELLLSLVSEQSSEIGINVFIVDNGSEGEQVERLEEAIREFESKIKVTLIKNEMNLGIPAAYNQAIGAARRNNGLYLRLDNDVVMLNGGLLKLCQAMDDHRSNGVRIVGCNTRYYSEPEKNDSGAGYFNLVRGTSRHEYPAHDVICDGVQGCVMLLDPDVVARFSPEVFDPWLFIMTDETELSFKAAKHGWKTYYVHSAVALHKRGKSTNKTTHINTFFTVRNWSYLSIRYGATSPMKTIVVFGRLISIALYHALKFKRDERRYDKLWGIVKGILRAASVSIRAAKHN